MRIVADPNLMRSAGSELESIANSFRSAYQSLLDAAERTMTGWDGPDNKTYVQKIQGLQDDYQRLFDLLRGAGNDLVQSAERYSQAQESVNSQAGRLRSDFC